jgi:hypothetical protein
MIKICRICHIPKDITEYCKKKDVKGGISNRCKACDAEKYQQRRAKNSLSLRDSWNKASKKYASKKDFAKARRLRRHHLTVEQYDTMMSKYDGLCWACKLRPACVLDHDHSCCDGTFSCGGCIRGLLCNQCNTSLGLMQEDPNLIDQLISYLKDS